ncbi:TPA: hypothetical protein PXJ37_001798 [Yersinia enterocolitica]|uniref:hypothetical protein n=1 Tax=Yersinia enterocolitica TaxID=630 RepID=UPI0005E953BD|nr:hypothetical protein [Yersinia enterocolitica]CFQ40789.1 Uncharacterised protein [Yersinia frederiksenii]CNH93876.1 Uncharacterised protein [Yersinia frederiksenii]HDL6612230.1 hypothetical protein [Yersinia enterocolitica]HEC1635939.1 hypothetical protein [Yersinia enterocolitica]
MKTNFIIFFIAASSLFSASSLAISQPDKEKLQIFINESKPYVVGMGRSAVESCQDMANDMVKRYGYDLSKIGRQPSEIRDSSFEICINALSSAQSAQSQDEIEMWKASALENIHQEFKNDTREVTPKYFLTESVNHSEKIARLAFFMMELSKKYDMK